MALPGILLALFSFGAGYMACSSSKEEEVIDLSGKHACHVPNIFLNYSKPKQPVTYNLVVHRFLDNKGGSTHPLSKIEEAVGALNDAYRVINHQFDATLIDHIDPEILATKNDRILAPINLLNRVYPHGPKSDPLVEGALHVFLVNKIDGAAGQADNYLVGFTLAYPDEYYNEVWVHEMGHVFGLKHPHDRFDVHESADNAQCRFDGDFLCDTPPDPYPYPPFGNDGKLLDACMLEGCKILSCPKDASGKPYKPDVGNWMGYYKGCREHFSVEQMHVMWCFGVQFQRGKKN